MKIYHGSTTEIKNPQILKTEKGRDFGEAFYTTPIKSQAERWAKRRSLIDIQLGNQNSKPIVNVYEYNQEYPEDLIKISFSEANEQWLDLVVQCRSNASFRHKYDIVEGKIADDSVGETVSFVVQGIMRKEDALEKLKFQKINSQIAFCTEKSLQLIRFLYSYEVSE